MRGGVKESQGKKESIKKNPTIRSALTSTGNSLGIVIRNSAKTVFSNYVGVALGVVNTVWLYPLILSPEEVGLVRTLIGISTLFATFAAFGAFTLPMKYFPYFKDEGRDHQGFLFFILSIGTAGFTVFSLALVFLKDPIIRIYSGQSGLILEYLRFFLPLSAIILFTFVIESYLVVLSRPVVPSIIREIVLRAGLSVALVLYWTGTLTQEGFVLTIVCIYGLMLVLLIAYTKREGELFVRPDIRIFKSPLVKDMAVFSSFVFIGNVSGLILQNVDTLIVNAYAGLRQTGIYSLAFFIATVIEVPKRTLSHVLLPIIGKASKENDVSVLKTTYVKSSINQLILGGFLFILVWTNIDSLFALMPNGDVYAGGKWVVFIIGISKLFDMTTGVNGEIIGTSHLYKYDLLFLLMLAFTGIALSSVLIPRYQLVGAALAAGIAVVVYNAMRVVFVYMLYRIQPFTRSTLIVLVIGAAAFGCNELIPHQTNALADMLLRTVILTAVVGPAVLGLKVSPDINDTVVTVVARIRQRIGRG